MMLNTILKEISQFNKLYDKFFARKVKLILIVVFDNNVTIDHYHEMIL